MDSAQLPRARSLCGAAAAFVAGLLYCNPAAASDAFDEIWSHARLYQSGEGVIRSIALSGRLQADAARFDADEGEFDDLLWRRFRFGFAAKLAGDWAMQLEGDFDLNEDAEDWYTRITDGYIGWNPGPQLDLRLLKHSAGFTLDGATSSKKLLTPQRNNLTNNLWFTSEYFTGISAQGVVDARWHYRAGVFSGDGDPEFSVSEGGVFGLFSGGYSQPGLLGLDTALVRLDYVRNDEDERSDTANFSDVVSLASQWERGPWGLWADIAAGNGHSGQSDIFGVVLMPFYNQNEQLQWVARYTFLDSAGDNGLKLGRYEREIIAGRGDRYGEWYAGLNYFVYAHKLKWHLGLQYASMDDRANDGGEYAGWGLTAAMRIYW